MQIVIRLKSGFELSVCCEKFNCEVNKLTGELTSYKISGAAGNVPVYLPCDTIECIYRVMEWETFEDGGEIE